MERQIRTLDKYMVSNASDAFVDYLRDSTNESAKTCYLLARDRFEEAVGYYSINRDIIDGSRPGIRQWLLQHDVITAFD